MPPTGSRTVADRPVTQADLASLREQIRADLRTEAVLNAISELSAKVDRLFIAIEDLDLLKKESGQADPRHIELLESLWAIVHIDPDVSFDAVEVTRHSQTDYRLSEALEAALATDTEDVGLLFRALKDKPIGRLILRRDKRGWRLECTSCT